MLSQNLYVPVNGPLEEPDFTSKIDSFAPPASGTVQEVVATAHLGRNDLGFRF